MGTTLGLEMANKGEGCDGEEGRSGGISTDPGSHFINGPIFVPSVLVKCKRLQVGFFFTFFANTHLGEENNGHIALSRPS